jgi:hypothetical protein
MCDSAAGRAAVRALRKLAELGQHDADTNMLSLA